MEDTYTLPGQFRYENMDFSGLTCPEMLDRTKTFKFKDTDQLVVGYPKSGTSWLRYVLALINSNGQEVPEKWTVFENAPALEFNMIMGKTPQQFVDYLESLPSPRIICTHLPSQFLEKQVCEGKIKTIVIMRNPKDTLVSFYHFYRTASSLGMFKGDWDQFFKMFKSNSLYSTCSVIENHVGWWRLRHQPNVFIVRYEDMKKDLRAVVRKLAAFCNKDLSDHVLDDIATSSTFEKLKDNQAINNKCFADSGGFDFTITKFMRKGQVGDWKNYFSASQNDYFEKVYNQVAAPVGLHYDFE